jgi:hypothetical protein
MLPCHTCCNCKSSLGNRLRTFSSSENTRLELFYTRSFSFSSSRPQHKSPNVFLFCGTAPLYFPQPSRPTKPPVPSSCKLGPSPHLSTCPIRADRDCLFDLITATHATAPPQQQKGGIRHREHRPLQGCSGSDKKSWHFPLSDQLASSLRFVRCSGERRHRHGYPTTPALRCCIDGSSSRVASLAQLLSSVSGEGTK